MANIEIELELTYLAKELPKELASAEPTKLVDIYIPEALDVHSRLRLRQKGDRYEITKKIPLQEGDASAHTEYTIPLEALEFDALAPASQKRIVKNRYKVSISGHDAEVDVFEGELKGLVLIDFEFSSEADKAGFTAPACCLADVTQESFVAGGNLAGRSYADIESDLKRFNYVPL